MPTEWDTARPTHSPAHLSLLPCVEAEAVEDPQWEVLEEEGSASGAKRGSLAVGCAAQQPPAARRRL